MNQTTKVVMNVAGSIDVDNVYLTREDLAAIMKADLSELEPAAVIARDIFLVGCWTAQRVSDYGNLTKDQFDTLTKRWIEDVPDPENPGKTKAELNEIVEIVETNGGSPTRVTKKKWELVHTHTARRTGATLMYLSGMDVYDIMKVTGHSSPIMLKKYIKADQLEVIEKITDKYDYFD